MSKSDNLVKYLAYESHDKKWVSDKLIHLLSGDPVIPPFSAAAMKLAPSLLSKFFTIVATPFVFAVPKIAEDERNAMPCQGYKVNPLKTGLQLLKLQFETEKRLPRIYQPILIIQANLD